MIQRAQSLLIVALIYSSPVLAQQWSIKQDIDPAKVVGHAACVECHKAEVAAWKQSTHFTKAHGLLLQKEAKEISREMDVQNATTDRRCTTCHGTQQEKVVSSLWSRRCPANRAMELQAMVIEIG